MRQSIHDLTAQNDMLKRGNAHLFRQNRKQINASVCSTERDPEGLGIDNS